MKWPGGKRFEDKFVEMLKKYGYKGSYLSKDWLKQPAFIQSFAPTSLIYVSNQTDLPKILLIDDVTVPTQDTNQVSVYSISILGSRNQLQKPQLLYEDINEVEIFVCLCFIKFPASKSFSKVGKDELCT